MIFFSSRGCHIGVYEFCFQHGGRRLSKEGVNLLQSSQMILEIIGRQQFKEYDWPYIAQLAKHLMVGVWNFKFET